MSEPNLLAAARARDYEAVERLLADGSDVDAQDEEGWTALCWAAGAGDLTLLRRLVEGGADVFKTGKDLRTPYQIALAASRVEAARFLREAEEQRGGDAEELSSREHERRPYCCAFPIGELRKYAGWAEAPLDGSADVELPDEEVVFLQRDFIVTRSMWPGEQVVFDEGGEGWRQFCADVLEFRPADDFDWLPEEADD